MALLALQGVPASELLVAFRLAEVFVRSPGSAEASSWLHLALVKHGRNTPPDVLQLPCRTTRDISLRLLALAAQSGSPSVL
jgi:hypothetical protein